MSNIWFLKRCRDSGLLFCICILTFIVKSPERTKQFPERSAAWFLERQCDIRSNTYLIRQSLFKHDRRHIFKGAGEETAGSESKGRRRVSEEGPASEETSSNGMVRDHVA